MAVTKGTTSRRATAAQAASPFGVYRDIERGIKRNIERDIRL